MKKYFLDLSVFILIFLFSIFALSNIGFLFNLSVNPSYILISFLVSSFCLFKNGNFFKKIAILCIVVFLSLIFSNMLIDTSFDGRCYHFTLENLFKLGYNPIYDDINKFANENNIFYNLLFASSYPNSLEVLRANFYLIFQNMESSKIVNFLFCFFGFFYSTYFFLRKLNIIKSIFLAFCVLLCAVSICQINTKMADFALYYLFLAQIFSIVLINKNINFKENLFILISASVLSIGLKYTGLLNTAIIFALWLFLKRKTNFKNILKISAVVGILSLILCAQPYLTNLIKFKNPFYPSLGHNKLDFMTKQNPKEFHKKPYLYKFFRSMFSSASDSRMNNPETPRLYYKVPFTSHFDMPYVAEDVRINGFGHLFSGIFILSLIFSIVQIKKKKGLFIILAISSTVFLNPICWWARFVPQLHLLPIVNCYYLRKNKIIFYILSFLIIINGFWVMKENYATSAYKTYVVHNFYNELYEKSQNKPIEVFVDKTPYDEEDTSIIFRMNEYGVNYKLVNQKNNSFILPKTDITITKAYYLKY